MKTIRQNVPKLLAVQVLPIVLACQQPSSLPLALPVSRPHDRPLLFRGPLSCVDHVCVYADPGFGSGLAVVTTADNAALLSDRLRLPSTPPHNNVDSVVDPPPFYEAYIPGKGIGLLANATIRRGDRLMAHAPTLLVHWPTHAAGTDNTIELKDPKDSKGTEELYAMALQQLPAPARAVFSQQMHIGGSGVRANIDTNCFRFFLDGGRDEATGHLCCYPPAARLNHDCEANCHYTITDGVQSIVAIRDSAAGEELSVSYIDVMVPVAERKNRLSSWGFACGCRLCTSPGASAAADARLAEIARLKTALDTGDASVTPATAHRLVALYEEQPGLALHIGQQAYTRAALVCGLFAEEACAVAYARRAVDALAIELGEAAAAASQDVLSMKRLAAAPREHWAWGLLRDRGRERTTV
ncbi:hypothetical protein SCUCBS95973_008777 [Sporothrix curviconia]|uniref:SET domain-containing protein n=1 Tax=Sporothrix curviconia TaxID=1260050 RepID=A0ABP0CQY9_9PEZI